MSTPTLVYKLLYEFGKLKGGALPASLRRIFVTGERFLPQSARNIERIIGEGSFAQPFVYGASETATIMLGRPDGAYRPILEDFIFEIHSAKSGSMFINPDLGGNWIRGNLVVTWLREGMLPILRYDTADVFSVRKEGATGEYVFRFEGRNDTGVFDIDIQNRIEAALFNISSPIYHFECRVEMIHSKVTVDVITAPGSKIGNQEVKDAIADVLGGSWSLAVELNRAEHPFFAFSPLPKTQKFIKC